MAAKERLSLPETSARTLIASEHVHRYSFAARLCAGLRVLDLACGSGYGSAILRESATAVTGVDRDAATVEAALATVGRDHDVSFEAADALEFLSRDLAADYDVIVCFEGLEHFRDPEPVLAQFERHANAGMKLIVSVPNSLAFEEENEFHVTDYGYEEARVAFGRFGEVTVLYQFLAEGSLIRTGTPAQLDAESALDEHGEPEWANHFIACVNLDEQLGELGDSARMQLAVAPVYNRWAHSLQRSNVELSDMVQSLQRAQQELSDRAHSLEQANREIFRENARIARDRMGAADSAAATMRERIEFLQQRVSYLEYLLEKPRHQAVERARDRLIRFPALDRVARSLGGWFSRD